MQQDVRTNASSASATIPTPPWEVSVPPSPGLTPETDDTLVSVSTTFFPGAQHQAVPPDAILISSDSVFFYIHTQLLLSTSSNAFNGLLPPPLPLSPEQDPIVHVQETSTVLNIVLHAIYSFSCAHYSPTFAHLCTAVRHLPYYGFRPKEYISPGTPLYSLLLSFAPLHPLELYALAASFDLYELAVATSSHLLSFPLPSLSDEMADAIGAIYLKRLFFLHFGRSDALRRVLLPPPHPHAPTQSCDFTDQKRLTRAWALASAYLAWDARPDLSTATMESALRPLEEHLSCELCRQCLRDRIQNLIVQWSIVKRTI